MTYKNIMNLWRFVRITVRPQPTVWTSRAPIVTVEKEVEIGVQLSLSPALETERLMYKEGSGSGEALLGAIFR